MKPIYKFNNGNGATLCHNCRKIISDGLKDALFCDAWCKMEHSHKEREKDRELKIQEEINQENLNANFLELKDLLNQLFKMLESVEESDNGYEFHPTVIRSCRVEHNMKLNDILPKIKEIIKDNKPKKAYSDFTKEEVDKILSNTHYP